MIPQRETAESAPLKDDSCKRMGWEHDVLGLLFLVDEKCALAVSACLVENDADHRAVGIDGRRCLDAGIIGREGGYYDLCSG